MLLLDRPPGHPLLNLTVKPQQPTHSKGLIVTRHRIRGSCTEGTCPLPMAQSAEEEVGRRVQKGPSRALYPGSSLHPRAPWGSTGPTLDPQGIPPSKDSNSAHQARLPILPTTRWATSHTLGFRARTIARAQTSATRPCKAHTAVSSGQQGESSN